MTWITKGKRPVTSHPQVLAMLRHAVAEAPCDVRRQRALARELFSLGDYRQALDAFRRLLAIGGDPGENWPSMAMAMLDVDGPAATLHLCAHRWRGAGTSAWHHVKAEALLRCGRIDDADVEFRRAIDVTDGLENRERDPRQESLRSLMRMHADRCDGAALLDACDAISPALRGIARAHGDHPLGHCALGHRALALSLLGRDDEANALVDLDAATMRFRFDPPGGAAGLRAFNDALADAVLADQPPGSDGYDVLFNYDLKLPENAGFAALQAFIEASYELYIDRFESAGWPPFIPSLPDRTTTSFGAVTLRRQGRNGQHIHLGALLTGVYHVRVPPVTGESAGALAIGVCDEIAPGHHASWGQRLFPAVPGTFTIFPAHYFHDVRPTAVDQPRVVIVADLVSQPL